MVLQGSAKGVRWEPMLPKAGGMPRHQAAYAFEFKWDGMRAIASCADGRLSLVSRLGNPQEARFPELAGLAGLGDMVLDGEIAVLRPDGSSDFGRLQSRFNLTRADAVASQANRHPVHFVAFDVLQLDGKDVRRLPYTRRREILEGLELDGANWCRTPAVEGDGDAVQSVVRKMGLEGLVAKRLDSAYRAGRSDAWVKVRNRARQEFVVGGWVEGERPGSFGGLLVGYWHGDQLRLAGCVDAGYSRDDVAVLRRVMPHLARDSSPFGAGLRGAHFLEPGIVVEAEFNGLTRGGLLRQPSFKGIRADKAAADVVWEQ